MRKLKFVWLVLAGLIVGAGGFSGLSFAEEAVVELGEVVVTATRVERLITDIPASVTVITREEIEVSPAKTVDDLLGNVAGVQMDRYVGLLGSCGGGVHISMRGMASSARVLILVDGVPLNTKFRDLTPLLNAISVQNIERIEIVRGASSALYGSSAMGGVINIITRRAEYGLSGNISLEAGNLDTQIGSLGLRYGAGNFGLRFAAERKQGGGYEFVYPWDPLLELGETKLDHTSLGVDYWLGESLLRLDIDNFGEDVFFENPAPGFWRWDMQSKRNRYRVSLETPVFGRGADFSIKGFYSDADFEARQHMPSAPGQFDVFFQDWNYRSADYGIITQVAFERGIHHLTIGADLSGGNFEQDQLILGVGERKLEGTQSLYAVFVNNEMDISDRLILSAGLRYDWWENKDGRLYGHQPGQWLDFPTATESALSPRGGVVYKLTERARLRASIGTGFRAPTLENLYKAVPFAGVYFIGNPELGPERLDWSYDVGVDLQPNENLNLSLTFYQSRLSDFIGNTMLMPGQEPDWLPSPGMPMLQPINIGEVDIHGVEAGLEVGFNDKWSAFANHTFNVSKVREHEKDPLVVGNYLSGAPRHISTIGVTYDNPQLFTLSLSITNESSRFAALDNVEEVEGFSVVNLRVSRKLLHGMEIFANVGNLTDEKYGVTTWALSPPFNALVGMRYTF